jgi:spermidine synthase
MQPRPQRGDFAQWLPVLFFLSGSPALLYQLIWERALFRIFGVSIESVTVVVTAFMIGLGVGSLAGGWLAERRRLRLPVLLAALEIGIAAFGVSSLGLFELVGRITAGWSLPGIAAAALAVLLVPTLLMGASLPVLVGYLALRTGSVGRSFGGLYYSNTLGAGAACILAIALVFPFGGMEKSVAIAALLNCAVAGGALLLGLRKSDRLDSVASPLAGQSEKLPRINLAAASCLAFCGGFVALSYEVFLYRLISFMTANNAAAFPLMLGAYLIGLAGGAREAALFTARGDGGTAAIGRGLAAGALVMLALLPLVCLTSGLNPMAAVVITLIATYVTARSWGRLLPYLAEQGIRADAGAGRRVSYIYLSNILGCAVGSFVTGFVLAQWLGLTGLSVLLGAIALAVTLLMPRAVPLVADRRLVGVLASALGLLALQHAFTGNLLYAAQYERIGPIVDSVQNRSGIITVDDVGRVYGNGIYDGQFNVSLLAGVNLIERAYAIQLYRPNPHRVLVVGLSSGSWAQVIAALPSVQKVVIVEINPGYATLVAEHPVVASLLSNPKVELIMADGRKWLSDNPGEMFDAVVSNTSIHFRANASNVLSREFMDLVRQHLNAGGALFYNTTGSLRAARTGCLAFRYGKRIENFIAVGDSPFEMRGDVWRASLEQWRIDGRPVLDLSRVKDRAILDGLASMPNDERDPAIAPSGKRVEDCSSVLNRTAEFEPITDDNMGTEWQWNLGVKP